MDNLLIFKTAIEYLTSKKVKRISFDRYENGQNIFAVYFEDCVEFWSCFLRVSKINHIGQAIEWIPEVSRI